jgi:hypothetical protein
MDSFGFVVVFNATYPETDRSLPSKIIIFLNATSQDRAIYLPSVELDVPVRMTITLWTGVRATW